MPSATKKPSATPTSSQAPARTFAPSRSSPGSLCRTSRPAGAPQAPLRHGVGVGRQSLRPHHGTAWVLGRLRGDDVGPAQLARSPTPCRSGGSGPDQDQLSPGTASMARRCCFEVGWQRQRWHSEAALATSQRHRCCSRPPTKQQLWDIVASPRRSGCFVRPGRPGRLRPGRLRPGPPLPGPSPPGAASARAASARPASARPALPAGPSFLPGRFRLGRSAALPPGPPPPGRPGRFRPGRSSARDGRASGRCWSGAEWEAPGGSGGRLVRRRSSGGGGGERRNADRCHQGQGTDR